MIDTAAPADLATLPLPARESHSSLSTYAACPRRYAFRYVERLPGEVPHWWFTFGSAVHRAFEAFDRARILARREDTPAPGYDVLAQAFDEAVDAAGVRPRRGRPVPRPQRARPPGLPRAGGHVGAEPVGVELGFGVDVPVADGEPPVRFVGYIDRIDRRSDGAIEVIDHKTGRLRSQEDVDRDRQLTAYAFACARGGLRDPATGEVLPAAARLGLHFAETGTHGLDHPVGRGARGLRRPPGRRGRRHPPPGVRAAGRDRVPLVRVPGGLPGCRSSWRCERASTPLLVPVHIGHRVGRDQGPLASVGQNRRTPRVAQRPRRVPGPHDHGLSRLTGTGPVAGTVGGFARLARVSAMRCSRRGAVTVRHHTERVRARVGEEGRDGG